MPDQPSPERFKVEMPQIPGLDKPAAAARPAGFFASLSPTVRLASGIGFVLLAGLLFALVFLRPKRVEHVQAEPAPQIVVPAPADTPPPPVATEAQPVIATVGEMAQPWSSKAFFFYNRVTGANVPALLVRLPGGSASSASSYWGFSLEVPLGRCQLEYLTDMHKLATDYGFRAKHPMVGDPCSRTVFDPLRLMSRPGNVWVRGAIVQGSDLRPPLAVEIKIQGKEISAVSMEQL
ncbi:MAG: hypothetical protein LAN61_15910 [Acidobacteriia bacterium]|nr:hypothetical protein [Terriglobia bacterium]